MIKLIWNVDYGNFISYLFRKEKDILQQKYSIYIYIYSFCVNDLYVSWKKPQKKLFCRCSTTSKYTFDISFIVEKAYQMSILSNKVKVNFVRVKTSSLSLIFLFLELIKNMLVWGRRCNLFSGLLVQTLK